MNPSKKVRLSKPCQESLKESMQPWECPICLAVPRQEVFQCANGHSICSLCSSQVKKCPTCRVSNVFGKNKIRNFALEEMLNAFKIKCCWEGCNEETSRADIFEHEEKCSFNPGLKICHFFDNSSKKCHFKFSLESLKDSHGITEVIHHFKSSHGIPKFTFKLGDTVHVPFCLSTLKPVNVVNSSSSKAKYFTGDMFSQEVYLMEGDKNHLFVILMRIELEKMREREIISFGLVQLTSPPDTDRLERCPFTVRMFITSFPKPDTIQTLDPACTGKISWTIKPIKLDQFLEQCKMPDAERSCFGFPMPISHLEEFYTGCNGMIKAGFQVTMN